MKKASQTEIFSNHIEGIPSLQKPGIRINVDCASLDEAIEKATRLADTLKEVQQIAKSLSNEEQRRENCFHCGRGLYQGCPNPDCKVGPERKPFQPSQAENTYTLNQYLNLLLGPVESANLMEASQDGKIILIDGVQGPTGKTTLCSILLKYGICAVEAKDTYQIHLNRILDSKGMDSIFSDKKPGNALKH